MNFTKQPSGSRVQSESHPEYVNNTILHHGNHQNLRTHKSEATKLVLWQGLNIMYVKGQGLSQVYNNKVWYKN